VKNAKIEKIAKKIALVLMGILGLLILLLASIGAFSEGEMDITNYDYEVAEKNEYPTGAAKRYSWDIVINEPLTKKQLEELAMIITDEAKEDLSFNALTLGFYDYKEYIGTGYTLGSATFAPKGDWSEANTVRIGDYDSMEFNFELKEKDWNLKLSDSEVEIFKARKDLYMSYSENVKPGELPDETLVNKEISEKFGITEEKVNEIMKKQLIWSSNSK